MRGVERQRGTGRAHSRSHNDCVVDAIEMDAALLQLRLGTSSPYETSDLTRQRRKDRYLRFPSYLLH
jgi:hypothetical protein